jgi:hypothetical protein
VSVGPTVARTAQDASPAAGGSNDFLNSDSCTSSTFCMAIGNRNLNGHTPALSEMLSRGRWVAVSVPSPSRGLDTFANEVSCASATSCLFVGQHAVGQGAPSNLAEAWNGSAWRIVTSTSPAGAATSGLFDVACPTTSFCLAVGSAGPARTFQDAAYTWTNGATWRQITVPHPRGARNSILGGLACFNASNCMAVGDYTSASDRFLPFAARWHDGRWAILTTPPVRGHLQTLLQGISCPAATRCVVVGNTVDRTAVAFHAFAEVWNGGKWQISTFRRPQSSFFGVSCPASNRCFAAGYTSARGFEHPLIETWNGRTWTTQNPGQTAGPHHGDSLAHVSCVSRSRCEAVGFRFEPGVNNSDLTLAEFWNGHQWTVQTSANP